MLWAPGANRRSSGKWWGISSAQSNMGSIVEGHKYGKAPARAGWRAGRGLGVSGEGRHIADRSSVVRVLWLRSSNGLESLDCWMKFPYL